MRLSSVGQRNFAVALLTKPLRLMWKKLNSCWTELCMFICLIKSIYLFCVTYLMWIYIYPFRILMWYTELVILMLIWNCHYTSKRIVPNYVKSGSGCCLSRAHNWSGETLGRWELGMGRDWGGGGQFTSNLGPGWTRIAPCNEEGFQVSKRERGIGKGVWQGELARDFAMT